MRRLLLNRWPFLVVCLPGLAAAATNDYFAIRVVDEQTGRGVPLVELRTVNEAAWWTDSNGIVALDEPGLMGLEVFFHVRSPGYEYPSDGFGNRGLVLKPRRGGSATVKIKRLNIAERLYRITGQGIYRDSVLLGQPVPLEQPLLNGQVMGQDTVIATPYRGRIYWFWGDTERPSYPLGNFHASGATSELPGNGGQDPSLGVDLTYFVDPAGFSRAMCPQPKGGLHWIESLFTVPDERGVERLVARMANVARLGSVTDWHLQVFNDEREAFEPLQRWDLQDEHESAHPFRARVDGTNYAYIFPNYRVPANLRSLADLRQYEALTCAAQESSGGKFATAVDRDEAGKLRYTWKAGAHRELAKELVKSGKIRPEESWHYLFDIETGTPLSRNLASVAWNPFRRRWIAFLADKPGDAWFAEADTPVGPWGYARRVLTHGDYNFYNLAHHSFFDQEQGRRVYFEGTYTAAFSAAREKTPRYDYNQLMYRLELDDPRLDLPVAVYRVRATNGPPQLRLREGVADPSVWPRIMEVAWFALPPETHGNDLAAVYASERDGTALSLTPPAPNARPLFQGLTLADGRPSDKTEGDWELRAAKADGEWFEHPLRLSIHGASARLDDLGQEVTSSGTFRAGKLSLALRIEDGSYRLEGRLEDRSFTGSWQKDDGTEKGTWSASRLDTTPPERRSPVLAVLREYRRVAIGRTFYSIEPGAPPGFESQGRPICRVWRVPGKSLVMDWKAEPR